MFIKPTECVQINVVKTVEVPDIIQTVLYLRLKQKKITI